MKYRFMGTAAAAAIAFSASPAMARDCSDLLTLELPGVTFTKAEAQGSAPIPADPMSAMTGGSPRPVPAGPHCLVEGRIGDREGVGGHYAIRFQMRLPEKWNGRFLFQGGGGTDGFIAPAIGAIPSTGSTATPALQRGYAVVSMDSGHDKPNLDFAVDQQAVLDLAYASIGKVSDTAKALIRARYGRSAQTSYFMGCSNGGREAMQAAMRFPTEFDGVVAGNPGFHLSRAALGSVWDVRQFQALAGKGAFYDALTQSDLDLVSSAVLKQCDELDGVKDGIVAAFGKCHFAPKVLRGKLSQAKLDTLNAVMGGPKDAQGNAVYSTWPWDPGINSAGWRAWKLGSDQRPAMHLSLSVPSTENLFLTPPHEIGTHPDYGQLAREVAQVGGYFDADETRLSTFVQRGGKMVIFQGAADPIFSADDIARWYGEAAAQNGDDFARLFVVPGMTHCGGGPAFEDFDPLTVLESWSQTGEAPLSMPAKAPTMPGREMPICA
ncbi:tannase/feruloyl esterase family alpha/beta hydrolase, partial [Novosphingobium sp. MBES04]|uniref:tannase/feruloyl esterase family alpha/beta hydrolase n=1 Tax=Novosphingobium sp. MBES04 TaxID=1206458 RepID=UPI00057FED3D